jgi:hypothetical protein
MGVTFGVRIGVTFGVMAGAKGVMTGDTRGGSGEGVESSGPDPVSRDTAWSPPEVKTSAGARGRAGPLPPAGPQGPGVLPTAAGLRVEGGGGEGGGVGSMEAASCSIDGCTCGRPSAEVTSEHPVLLLSSISLSSRGLETLS